MEVRFSTECWLDVAISCAIALATARFQCRSCDIQTANELTEGKILNNDYRGMTCALNQRQCLLHKQRCGMLQTLTARDRLVDKPDTSFELMHCSA